MEFKKNIPLVLRGIISLVFIFSSITKLSSLADFEVYIYSLNVIGLDSSYIVARLLIGLEFTLGILLLIGIYFKPIKKIAGIALLAFTIGLAYIHFTGGSENCQCFGDVIHMTPLQAIVKNLILLSLLIAAQTSNKRCRFQKPFVFWVIFIAAFTSPFLINPPDNWSHKIYGKETKLGLRPLNSFLRNSLDTIDSSSSKKLIAFYGAECRFCKQAAKRVSEIVQNHNIESSHVLNIFWGKTESAEQFYIETSTIAFDHQIMDTETFFGITKGQMPLILLIENGELILHYQLANINEGEITHFFKD